MIAAISPDNLRRAWSSLMRFIQEPLEFEHGNLTPERVYDEIAAGNFVLLVVYEGDQVRAVQTVEILETARGRLMNLVTTGGEFMASWLAELAETLENLARDQDCYAIHTRGRPGWLRVLKSQGYEPLYFIAEKKL